MTTSLLRSICFAVGVFLTSAQAISQNQTVSGKVTSKEDATSLPGVTVVVQNTTTGVTTDSAGVYSISVPSGGSLIFSMVGMKKQIVPVGANANIDVELAPDGVLHEVVVTALGMKQEKRALGYSVQEVKGVDIANTQRDNFLVSMQGRVAGLNITTTSGSPGASASIILRGANSIGGNNSPLFVIDGLPVSNNTFAQGRLYSDQPNRTSDYLNRVADLNPNDIESISVLKGGEAAALYGIDAAGGAIVITTKKGTSGKAKITYENRFRTDEVTRFPEVQTVYGRGTNGQLDPNTERAYGPKYQGSNQFYDNTKNYFQTGFTQYHGLTLEGGSQVATYRLSTSYTDQSGIIPTTGLQKLTTKLTGRVQISPQLEAISSISYTDNKIQKALQGPSGSLFDLLLWPANDDARNYLNADGTRRLILGNGVLGESDNPFFSVNKNKNSDKNQHTNGTVQLNYAPLTWLKFQGNFGADIDASQGNQFLHPETSFSNGSANGGGGSAGGSVESYSGNFQQLNGNLYGTATKSFGKFRTSLLLGAADEDRKDETYSVYGEKLYLPDFNSVNNTDPTTQRNKYTLIRRRVQSLLGSYTLNYNDILYLNVTGRNDWSSTLPPANNSFFYPSISGSFVFSEAPFFHALQSKFFTFGKLRASYSEVGRDAPPYNVLSSLTPQTTTGGGFAYGFFGGNPALKPERSKGFELGTELKFFQNRFGIDFTFYNRKLSDQIVSQRLSYGTGFIFGLLNGGTFTNQGVELVLNGSPFRSRDFDWDIFLSFTKFTTKVESLPANVAEYYNSDTWIIGNARASAFVSNLQDYYPGAYLGANQRGAGSATAIGGYSYLRNNRGDILVNPTSGLPVINSNFLPIGDRNPDFTVGLTNQFRYKNLNLSFLLDIRKGGDVFNGTAYFMWLNGLSAKTLDRETPVIFKGVLRDGKENSDAPTANDIQVIPYQRSSTYYASFAEADFVEHNINWVRLRDITLSYDFPQSWIKNMGPVRKLGLYVTGTDLFLITNYTGADPNVNGTTAASGGVGAGGFDIGKVSVPRGIAFGLRVGL